MTTTTFDQVIGDQTFTITVPVKRVEKLIDRIDNLRWLGREAKAIQLLKPFVGAPQITKQAKPVLSGNAMVDFATKLADRGRYQVVKALQTEFDISYQKARNIAIKAGIS